MPSTRNPVISLTLLLVLRMAAMPASADDSCVDFKWDVSKERALFAQTPVGLTAGKDPRSAPAAVAGRLYSLHLTGQDQVAFAVAPGKKAPTAPAYAGLATVKVPAAGSYRISIDLPLWIDVVSKGALLQPTDFQGQHGCNAPHKIVEFALSGAEPLVLQLSNGAADTVRLTITPAPQRKL
jgi:hypothetical protein